jgi:phosphoribosyl-ATP pyrophosphohydrolase/phosphoribosyl-AMP cyclohydrolase
MLKKKETMKLNFEKSGGLIPAIIQDARTKKVLMLGYMNEEALEKTRSTGKATFYSRGRQQLWTKGETSGNFLHVKEILEDCDQDTLLIKAIPEGPTCHTGKDTCFNEENNQSLDFLIQLQDLIEERKKTMPEGSYTTKLFKKGINKIAQKVGEEAVELVIEAKDDDDGLFLNEGADLMYHLLVLLAQKGYQINDIVKILEERHGNKA